MLFTCFLHVLFMLPIAPKKKHIYIDQRRLEDQSEEDDDDDNSDTR